MFEGRGPLAILLLVLIGGLALNLTPCVLPMIPINIAIIGAGAQAGSRARGFLLGAAYGAAMALVYGVIGLVVILTAGTFGTINASPWFNLAIAVLFVVLGLAMFDVLMIDFSRFGEQLHARREPRLARARVHDGRRRGAARRRVRRAGRHPGRALLEQPLRGRHDARPRAAVLPRPRHGAALAASSAPGIAALPKPGVWMVRVKQAFGVFILATARLLRLPGLQRCSRTAGSIRRP